MERKRQAGEELIKRRTVWGSWWREEIKLLPGTDVSKYLLRILEYPITYNSTLVPHDKIFMIAIEITPKCTSTQLQLLRPASYFDEESMVKRMRQTTRNSFFILSIILLIQSPLQQLSKKNSPQWPIGYVIRAISVVFTDRFSFLSLSSVLVSQCVGCGRTDDVVQRGGIAMCQPCFVQLMQGGNAEGSEADRKPALIKSKEAPSASWCPLSCRHATSTKSYGRRRLGKASQTSPEGRRWILVEQRLWRLQLRTRRRRKLDWVSLFQTQYLNCIS